MSRINDVRLETETSPASRTTLFSCHFPRPASMDTLRSPRSLVYHQSPRRYLPHQRGTHSQLNGLSEWLLVQHTSPLVGGKVRCDPIKRSPFSVSSSRKVLFCLIGLAYGLAKSLAHCDRCGTLEWRYVFNVQLHICRPSDA